MARSPVRRADRICVTRGYFFFFAVVDFFATGLRALDLLLPLAFAALAFERDDAAFESAGRLELDDFFAVLRDLAERAARAARERADELRRPFAPRAWARSTAF